MDNKITTYREEIRKFDSLLCPYTFEVKANHSNHTAVRTNGGTYTQIMSSKFNEPGGVFNYETFGSIAWYEGTPEYLFCQVCAGSIGRDLLKTLKVK